mgnify:CR=1 FL=1|jgi:hypothetical protein
MSPKIWSNTIGADARNLDGGEPNQLSYLDDDGKIILVDKDTGEETEKEE